MLGSVACGNSAVKEFEGIVGEMCACKDMKCLEGVQKKMEELGKKYKDKEPSEADQKAMKPVMEKMQKCVGDIMKAGAAGGGDKPADAKE